MTKAQTNTEATLWTLVDHGKNCGTTIRFELYEGQRLVASLEDWNVSKAKRDGERILCAVNSHDELVAALDGLMTHFVGERSSKNVVGEVGIVCDKARAALRNARGEG